MDPNEPAYPQSVAVGASDDVVTSFGASYSGLTIRAEFAKAAMKGILSNPSKDYERADLAVEAVAHADALIAELNKTA